MKIIPTNYQMSLFGNFFHLGATTENIVFFAQEFQEFNLMPSTFNEVVLNGESLDRISLRSNGNNYVINILTNRIDIFEQVALDSDYSKKSIDAFKQFAFNIIRKILPKIILGFNRISIVPKLIFSDVDKIIIDKLGKKIFNLPEFYLKNTLNEWGNRIATQYDIPNNERVNVISEMKVLLFSLQIENLPQQCIYYTVDINTLAENQDYRFNEHNLFETFDLMISLSEKLIEEAELFLNN